MKQSPSALLMIATGCQHCPVVLQAMGELVKAGTIGRLEIINIQQNPEAAKEHNVRSVPWVKIGDFELVGLRSQQELARWAERAGDPAMMGEYFSELMTSGEIDKVQAIVENNPQHFSALLQLMADPDSSLSARIGVGALMEEFANGNLLKQNIDALGAYTENETARVRNDACHYLGLSGDTAAEKYIRPLLEDSDAEVREVAREALDELP
jgi:hypothetical protein